MSFPYKNPISPSQLTGQQSLERAKTYGTNYSILSTGGYMEVFSLDDLLYTIPPSTFGPIEYSGNSIPITFSKGSGTTFSYDTLTLHPDNISSGRRKLGMMVYVYEENQLYQFIINNYETLWNNATGSTGTTIISDFGTTIKADSPENITFINSWTANTIDGVSGETYSTAVWKKLPTSGGGSGDNVTGGTFDKNTETLTLVTSSGNTINITGFSDVFVTGGTYSAGTATFTNNTGGTFNVVGFFTGDTDNFITGGTFDKNTETLTLTNSTGGTISISGFSDVFVTGGTYSNGDITFTNNTGGTFNVSGLFTGNTDVFVTGSTYNNNTFTFTNNTGGTFDVSFNTITGLTINGNLNISGDTEQVGDLNITGNTIIQSGITASSYNISITPIQNDSLTQILGRNITTGEIEYRDINTIGNNYTYVSGATYSALTTDNVIGVDSSISATTIYLPDSITSGRLRYDIKDIGLNSYNNNITILSTGSDTIISTENSNNVVLESDGGALIFFNTATGIWLQM